MFLRHTALHLCRYIHKYMCTIKRERRERERERRVEGEKERD
jgi:hypothetical protein